MLVGPLLMLSAAIGALAAGLPIWMLPAPLVAASGLAMFHDSRAMRDYALFVVGALATGAWFMWHHFGFLEIAVGGLPLRALCALVLAAMVPATLLPGLQHAGEPALAAGWCWERCASALHVCCCCCCWGALFSGLPSAVTRPPDPSSLPPPPSLCPSLPRPCRGQQGGGWRAAAGAGGPAVRAGGVAVRRRVGAPQQR